MYGPGHGWGFGLLWQIGAFIGGLVVTVAIIALTILLVRYLIVATRAAQLYVDSHSGPTTTSATQPPPTTPTTDPPATPPAAAPAAKPAPRSRTPKTPPAAT